MITALAAMGALVFSWLNLKVTRDQVVNARDQTSVSEQGQFTERLKAAVGQLDQAGPEHIQARLGGVYLLERLAYDSPRDQPTIIEVLSAFVRTTTPTPATASTGVPTICPKQPLSPDIQIALTVLGRRNTARDNRTAISLERTCLRTAGLPAANLVGAYLAKANLGDANLSHVYFRSAYLYAASFSGTNLVGASFTGANLTGADLTGADLTGADLTGADLTGANLIDATLNGANFGGAKLNGANLGRSKRDAATKVHGATTDDRTVGKWW